MSDLLTSIFSIISAFFSGGGAQLFLPIAYGFAVVCAFDIFLSLIRR